MLSKQILPIDSIHTTVEERCGKDLQVCIWLDGVAAGEGEVFNPVEVLGDVGHSVGGEVRGIAKVQLHQANALLRQHSDICRVNKSSGEV